MKLPCVIDNQTYRLSDILNGLLAEHKGRSEVILRLVEDLIAYLQRNSVRICQPPC